MLRKKDTKELKKHVGAIHCSNSLSLLQRKISNALLFNAYPELNQTSEHQIDIKTLCKLIGYRSHDDRTIKTALISLISTVIEWNILDKDNLGNKEIWNASSIIADARIHGAVCTYSYSNRMRELLHHPEMYGRLNMEVQAKFKSTYGLALYENCIRYQNLPYTKWFDVDTFRLLMGVEKGKYLIFRDLKRRVIDKAIEEVNQFSPIKIQSEYLKKSRNVVSVRFLIESAFVKHDAGVNLFKEGEGIIKKLCMEFGFSETQANKVLSKFEEEYVLEKIKIVEASKSYKDGSIVSLSRYLQKALEDNYQPILPSQQNKKQNKRHQQQKEDREIKEKWSVEYREYRNQKVFEQFENMSSAEKKKILLEFEKHIEKTVYSGIYAREKLDNVLVRDNFSKFFCSQRTELLPTVLNFKEYVESR